MINFAFPYALLLLPIPFIYYFALPAIKGMHGSALKVPFLGALKRISISSGGVWTQTSGQRFSKRFWGMYVIWSLLCLAAIRPQILGAPYRLQNESRDIMLVLDLSTSMLEPDFRFGGQRLSRLDAVKNVVSDFADKRANDRLGLVLFGTRAYLQAPLTFDKASIKQILASMQAGMAGESTSIGDALGLALKTLSQTETKNEKVIILLTDGENNDGALSLAQAIKMAADEKIKTYTIGVGSKNAFFQMLSMSSGVDEQGLKLLAKATKGQYFRAENAPDLQKVYHLIDQLEPSANETEYVRDTTELYYIPLLCAVVLALGAVLAVQRSPK